MYRVVYAFLDITDLSHKYEIGDEFTSDDSERVKDLLNRKFIEGVVNTSSFELMSKKEIEALLKERAIEFNSRATKEELLNLLKGSE